MAVTFNCHYNRYQGIVNNFAGLRAFPPFKSKVLVQLALFPKVLF